MNNPITTQRSTVSFYNAANALFDPDTVTCTVSSPDPTIAPVTYTFGSSSNLTKTAVGQYQCLWDADIGGRWYARWYGEDTVAKITQEDPVDVYPTH